VLLLLFASTLDTAKQSFYTFFMKHVDCGGTLVVESLGQLCSPQSGISRLLLMPETSLISLESLRVCLAKETNKIFWT